jgi:hypothetical protein
MVAVDPYSREPIALKRRKQTQGWQGASVVARITLKVPSSRRKEDATRMA